MKFLLGKSHPKNNIQGPKIFHQKQFLWIKKKRKKGRKQTD